MANSVDLNGSEYIQNIPGVYFDATSSLVKSIGKDELSSKYIGRIGFGAGTVVDLTINLAQDPDNPGKVIASTAVADGTVYVLGGAVVDYVITEILIGSALAITGVATAPVWLTIAGVGATVVATTYLGSMAKEFLYDITYNGLSDIENFDFYSPEIVGTVSKDKFIAQSATNDPNFCKNIFPQYINYRQITEIKSGSESFLYNQLTKEATVNSSNEKEATEVILKDTDAKKLTLNNQTYDISSLNNLELRNAIDGIDKVSFLLSNITIYAGEEIDLGSKGIYKVKSGDTLSTIAQNLHDGTVTKDLVKLNPWLFDDGRIVFDYPDKVLIKEGTIISDNHNHTLNGTNADDILKDHNGGNDTLNGNAGNDHLEGGTGSDTLHGGSDNDTLLGGADTDYLYGDAGDDTLLGGDDNASDILVGGSGEDVLLGQGGDDILVGGNSLEDKYSEKVSDYLSGGSGYDTYYVSHQDIIEDADGSGLVMFNNKPTNGKKTKVDEYTYEDDNFTYTIDKANLIVVDKMLGEYITILNYQDGALGIGLDKDGDDKKAIELFVGDATTTEGGDLTFTVAITEPLKYDLSVDVGSYFNGSASADDIEGAISGTVVIKAGESSADFTIKSKTDDIDEGVENFMRPLHSNTTKIILFNPLY